MADYTSFYEFKDRNIDENGNLIKNQNYKVFNQLEIPNLKNIAPNYEVRLLKRVNFENNNFCILWNDKDKYRLEEIFDSSFSLLDKYVLEDWQIQVYENHYSKVRNIIDFALGIAYAKEIGFWGKNSYYWHKLPQQYITTQKQYENALKCAKNTFLDLPFKFEQGKHIIIVPQ